MLKPPFIRQGAVTRSRRAVPLEYGILSGSSSSRSGVNVQVLSELKAKSRWGLSTSPSLAIFVYNSLALRLLINEGILYNIVSTTAVSVKSVLQLLHPAPRFPSLAARGKAAGSDREEAVEGQEAVRQLVWSAQKEYASFVRGIMPESLRPTGGRCGTLHGRRGTLRWSLREVWDCTAAVFKDFVRQDDLLSLQLLLPVAQCISADDKEGRVLQGNLESLLKHRAHGGVLWLLWRFAGPSKRANSKFLEAAVMAVCEVATSDLLQLPRNVSHRYEFVTVPPPGKGEDEKQLAFFMKLLPVFNVTSRGDCFSPFWRLLLYEMVRYAHLELLDANAEPRAQVGALQSLRRIICSFRRHGCVLPILFLHEVITSSAILLRGGDGAASESLFAAAASGRYGPLVYREILLLDAYALMTVGHVGETADDVGENVVGKTVELQARCAAHLNDLEQSNPGEGSDRDIIGLHRGARAAIEQRLQEAIRVSFKLLLRCGAYEVIERQMQNYPSLGGSWEGGKALVLLGKYTEAVDIFSKFLVSTRSRFAGGLPHHIRDMVLGALEGASRHYCNEGGEALASLLRLYDVARTWKFPLPPAVAFAAIVRGCTTANGESLGRLELLRALLNYHTLSAVYRSDGLLSCVVKLYVHLLGECRNVVSASLHFELLSMLDRAHPGLFVCRVALLHFLDVNYDEGVNIVLRRLVDAPACPVTRLKPLQEMPRAVLDTLQRHIEAGALGKYAPSVFDALRTAIEYRRCVDMQRQPWRCCACGCWNPRGAPACKHCGSLELAVVQCGLCGGFSPTNSLYCPVCGTETLERNVGDRCELVPREGCTLYPLRQWRCGRCNHKNEPRHLFYCARCASPQPIVEHALAHTAFLCTICNHHNPLGMLRPWCSACGTLCSTASCSPSKTLWHCVECNTLSPWLLTHCHGCGSAKTNLPRRLDTPWFTRKCSHCSATNPAWNVFCHGCGNAFPSVACGDGKREIGPIAETNGALEPVYTSCPHCGCPYTGEDAVICSTCFAYRPHTACVRWVCLKDDCLGVNVMRDVGNNSLTCGHCGVTHDTLAPASHHTDPLCYRYPSAAGDVRVEVPEDERATGAVLTRVSLEQAPQARGRDRGGGGASGSLSGTERCLPTALLLPVPSGPTSCASCGAYLRLENIVGICLSCNHCNNHLSGSFTACRSELELTLRLKLKAMLDIARRATRGSLLCSDALKMLCSLTAALQRADETHLPWRGCDLSKDMMCGVSPRMPVFEDETVHGAVSDVAEILQSICVIAGTMASGDAVEATATETSWARKRPWISVALDLVDLMNRTTDYDELGFDVLARLCEVIRPSQRAHIYRETRWAYLRHMKLPREWIVNDVVCSTCLLTNRTFSPDSVVEGVCRCAESPGTAATYAIGTHRETAADKKMA